MTTQDTPTPIEQQRAAFEAWCPYSETGRAQAWEAWQAAIAHNRQQRGEPSGYAYRYSSHDGGTVIRFNNGGEVNGSRPIESVPYWFAPQPADPVRVPSDEELIAWATEEEFFLFCDEDEFLQIARALLARYGAPTAAQEPVAYRTRYRSEPGMIGHYPWAYTSRNPKRGGDPAHDIEPLYAAPVAAQPENIRAGDPYDDPAFEGLCREHHIWGTAESALCAVFWRAGKTGAQPIVPDGEPMRVALSEQFRRRPQTRALIGMEALVLLCVRAAMPSVSPTPPAGGQAQQDAEKADANTGHGHVFPRPDNVKMRCGGPGICPECSRDAARAQQGGQS